MASASPPPVDPEPTASGGSGEAEQATDSAVESGPQALLCSFSAFSHIPTKREGPPELSYFHQEAKTGDVSTFDAIFRRPEGYNQKLHRCDREHAKNYGLNIYEEEMARPVALLSSSEYGRHMNKSLEQPVREHARVYRLQAELYRKNGIPSLAEKTPPTLDPCYFSCICHCQQHLCGRKRPRNRK